VLFAIPLAIISFVITMGFAKIVEAAEDRLNN
jgi:multisubunit Na+/H+ antiporter MnhF subunit